MGITSKQGILLPLIIIILVGFALRFTYIDRSMRFDEAQTAYLFANRDIPSVVADYGAPNNHIFHTLFVHIIMKYVGNAPIFVRLPAFIASILLIPSTFVVATRFYNRLTGLIASSLVAIMPILIDFSVNARGYAFIALFVMWLVYLGQELQTRDNTVKWLIFALLASLGFFTIPIMLYPMGMIAVWLLVSIWFRNKGEVRINLLQNYIVSIALGAILTLIFYTPVFVFSGIDKLINSDVVYSLPAGEYYPQFGSVLLRIWQHIIWDLPVVVTVIYVLLLLIGIVYHRKLSGKYLPIIPFAVVWIVPVLLIQRYNPFPRTWYFLVPLVLISVSAGLVQITNTWKKWQIHIVSVTMILITATMGLYIVISEIIITSPHTSYNPDAEKAAFVLDELMTNNDVLAMYIPSNYLVLYYSMVHDLSPASVNAQEEAGIEDVDVESRGYVYIFYHTHNSRSEYLELADAVGDYMENSEVLYEWEHSVLRRAEIISNP